MERMIAAIEADVAYTADLIGRRALGDAVMEAMRAVPRHAFVDPDQLDYAYDNRPLPIGCGQTISQPYIVALMSELLATEPHHRVLEIGTGSGYQAAVLAHLVSEVISLEIIPALADSARERLARLGYSNVRVIEADGHAGWPNEAPYDGILVTAAPTEIPPALIEQLAPGAHLIIPVGAHGFSQRLLDIHKEKNGRVKQHSVLGVSFVPLTGG